MINQVWANNFNELKSADCGFFFFFFYHLITVETIFYFGKKKITIVFKIGRIKFFAGCIQVYVRYPLTVGLVFGYELKKILKQLKILYLKLLSNRTEYFFEQSLSTGTLAFLSQFLSSKMAPSDFRFMPTA